MWSNLSILKMNENVYKTVTTFQSPLASSDVVWLCPGRPTKMATDIINYAQLSFRFLLRSGPKCLFPLNLLIWRKKQNFRSHMNIRCASVVILCTPTDCKERVDKQKKDPCASSPEQQISPSHFLFCLWPVPCGLLRSVCDNNKTHHWHSWRGKSTWVDWPSLECCVKFSAPPSFPLLYLSVRYAVTGSVFLTNSSTEISNQLSIQRRYRHLSGNAPISFSI